MHAVFCARGEGGWSKEQTHQLSTLVDQTVPAAGIEFGLRWQGSAGSAARGPNAAWFVPIRAKLLWIDAIVLRNSELDWCLPMPPPESRSVPVGSGPPYIWIDDPPPPSALLGFLATKPAGTFLLTSATCVTTKRLRLAPIDGAWLIMSIAKHRHLSIAAQIPSSSGTGGDYSDHWCNIRAAVPGFLWSMGIWTWLTTSSRMRDIGWRKE